MEARERLVLGRQDRMELVVDGLDRFGKEVNCYAKNSLGDDLKHGKIPEGDQVEVAMSQ